MAKPDLENDVPGVPGFRTWRGIYLFVGIVFVVWIALLTLLTRWFA